MNESILIYYCYLKTISYLDFLSFHLVFFFFPRIPSRTSCHHVYLGSSGLWQFLRLSLFRWPWECGGVLVRYFVECPLNGVCLLVFLMISPRLWIVGRKVTRVKCHFYDLLSRAHTVDTTNHCYVDLESLAEVVFVRFVHCIVILFFSFLEGSHDVQPTLQEWMLYSTPQEQNIYISYLVFFCMGGIFLLPPLFVQSYVYIKIDS